MTWLRFLWLWQNTLAWHNLGRKGFISFYSFQSDTPPRAAYDLIFKCLSACHLVAPRTTCPGDAQSMVSWGLSHQSSVKVPQACPQTSLIRATSQVGFLLLKGLYLGSSWHKNSHHTGSHCVRKSPRKKRSMKLEKNNSPVWPIPTSELNACLGPCISLPRCYKTLWD